MTKLRKSGYSECLRKEILKAAVKTYRNKIRTEELGIRPFHRLAGHDAVGRRRKKVSAKENWFKQNRSSWKERLQDAEKVISKEVEKVDGC